MTLNNINFYILYKGFTISSASKEVHAMHVEALNKLVRRLTIKRRRMLTYPFFLLKKKYNCTA
jgi:hypothetical protein